MTDFSSIIVVTLVSILAGLLYLLLSIGSRDSRLPPGQRTLIKSLTLM